ncbi:PREDICTED: protein ABHD11 [Tarenaya hassleriana]|uniref:protein ABHD11 n=1 Tax=Tarenaya hassleriana TaxID=28532 RepID=UPI00053C4E84|nr:PREDICTED: protein ABHD11 [Tarenaya hassleriana]
MARVLKNRLEYRLLTRNVDSLSRLSSFFASTRSLKTLAYEEIRNSDNRPYDSTAIVIHGLLGSGRNWRSFSLSLASSLSAFSGSEWRMVLVDLRNHGRSTEVEGLDPPHDLVSSAKDVADLVKGSGWDWPDVVVGHSLGGKVALQFLESCINGDYGESASPPKQLWVLDSVPGEVKSENSDGEVEKVLQTLQSLPSPIPSRKWLVEHMLELGFSRSLSEWIGSNLKRSGDTLTWAFNLEGAIQMFSSYRATSYWSLLENPPKDTEINVVMAEKSDRWDPETSERLERIGKSGQDSSTGKASTHLLENSGHWVHVDNPKGLLEIITPNFLSLQKK